MEHAFYTLQDFMFYSKSVTYILIVAVLLGFVWFWSFLNERDD
jgi:hypothetical protein